MKRSDEIQYTAPLTALQSEELEEEAQSYSYKECNPIQEMWLGPEVVVEEER